MYNRMPMNWTYHAPAPPTEIKKYLKVEYQEKTFFLEFSQQELKHLTVDAIKDKIRDKINMPVEDQELNIIFYGFRYSTAAILQDNHASEDNRFVVLSADNCFTEEALDALFHENNFNPDSTYLIPKVSLKESLSYQRRYEQQLREKDKLHTFLI